MSGVRIQTMRLLKCKDVLFLDGVSCLRLEEYLPGLYFSSTGEAFDMRATPPTYANIPFHR
jgi:hypothetical protein